MKQNWEQVYSGDAWKYLSKQSLEYKHCPFRNPFTCGSKGVQVGVQVSLRIVPMSQRTQTSINTRWTFQFMYSFMFCTKINVLKKME